MIHTHTLVTYSLLLAKKKTVHLFMLFLNVWQYRKRKNVSKIKIIAIHFNYHLSDVFLDTRAI